MLLNWIKHQSTSKYLESSSYNWFKCNTDGAAKGATGMAACGGIFRDKNAAVIGCFAYNIGNSFAFHAEIVDIITAVELAHQKGWNYIWLECDSQLAIQAFSNPKIVPWMLRNRWLNC